MPKSVPISKKSLGPSRYNTLPGTSNQERVLVGLAQLAHPHGYFLAFYSEKENASSDDDVVATGVSRVEVVVIEDDDEEEQVDDADVGEEGEDNDYETDRTKHASLMRLVLGFT